MRLSLLNYVCCPACRGSLECFGVREAPEPGLGGESEIEAGALACSGCHRWFPILDSLPELLPDHLRDAARDISLLPELGLAMPADVRARLRNPGPAPTAAEDAGAHYKRAEIGIAAKVEEPEQFFAPGRFSPFNPDNTDFTLYLIALFGNVVQLLGVREKSDEPPDVVIDSGCGYAWTSEWLAKSGLNTIGVDICRAYLEIGIKRMGASRPHLVIADVENLPIADTCANAVLGFESFHHIPDRPQAMAGYARSLKDGGAVVLAEPGAAHEAAAVSVDAMTKYGILERGMEMADVQQYITGLPFAPPEQLWVLHASTADLERGITLPSAWRYAVSHSNIFRLRKNAACVAPRLSPTGIAQAGPRTAGAAPAPASAVADNPDELRARHEELTRQWNAELQRTAAELHSVTLDVHAARAAAVIAQRTVADMERSLFWRARRGWVWLAGLLGLR